MKVYTVGPDTKFQMVTTDNKEFFRSFPEYGKPLGNCEFPSFYVEDLKAKKGNFFSTVRGPLLFDQKALNALTPSIQLAGELFSVPVEEQVELTYCNLLEVCDCLDEEKSSAPVSPFTGKKSQIIQFAFKSSKIQSKSGLFRIPYGRSAKIFAVTDMPSREDDFYSLYHSAELTGLEFRWQWTDEEK